MPLTFVSEALGFEAWPLVLISVGVRCLAVLKLELRGFFKISLWSIAIFK